MITRTPFQASLLSAVSRPISRPYLLCRNYHVSPSKRIQLRRQYSTPSPSPISDVHAIPPPPIQPKSKRSLRPYIYATIFAFIGISSAQYINLIIAPPPLPQPGTNEDKLMIEYLHKQASNLPLVKSLMEDPNWVHNEAYSGFQEEDKPHRLTTGPLGGARGIEGFHRVFYNEATGEHIAVVFIGGAVSGWPGVVHGGITATLMDEMLGRSAIKMFPSKTGVTANLELSYMKPLLTNSFYIFRTSPQKDGTENKQWVSGRVETLDGRICVEAKGLFVVPKKFKTKALPETSW